VVELVDTYV